MAVDLSQLTKARLKNSAGTSILASQLWAATPVLVMAVRRPGCVLCREEAQNLWAKKADFDRLGIRLVAVLKEWIQAEIDDFQSKFWPNDELYLDEEKVFFKALNNGDTHSLSLTALANPLGQAWKNVRRARKAVEDHNLKGEGFIAGGLLIIRPGQGGVSYAHLEKTFGDYPPINEVLAAAKKATGR